MRQFVILSCIPFIVACDQYSPTTVAPISTLLSIEQTSQMIKSSMSKDESADLWANDIHQALGTINLPATPDNVCAVVAVIEQESGFKADPPVAGIRQILAKKIAKMESDPLLAVALKLRLSQIAVNGKTFRINMQSIRTEHDFEVWYNEFTAGKYTFLGLKYMNMDVGDLITTAGSMQVSVAYARDIAFRLGQSSSKIRDQVYSRAGGVLYGSAHLLYYPADYSAMYYRFADYNAGHYASRNAAFQQMIIALTGDKKVGLDGDLLSYQDGKVMASQTYRALLALAKKQKKEIIETDLMADLKQGKQFDFTETATYQWVASLYEKKYNKVLKEQIPSIVLKSDKFKRRLTTKWYADNVNRRFKNCLGRKV